MGDLMIGDKVRYLGGDEDYGNLTVNKVYEITGEDDCGDAHITNDAGYKWFVCYEAGNLEYFELIEEAEDTSEPQSDVHALLANLARRLSEVEAAQERASFEAIVDDFEEAVADLSGEGNDVVNSPAHYKLGKFETIEVIEEITKGYDDGFVAHCAGTAIKYIARAPYKHDTPLEDLRKAARYLDYAIERLQVGDTE